MHTVFSGFHVPLSCIAHYNYNVFIVLDSLMVHDKLVRLNADHARAMCKMQMGPYRNPETTVLQRNDYMP